MTVGSSADRSPAIGLASTPETPGPVRPGLSNPERWIAVLRIAVGLWFLKSILTKLEPGLLGGWLPALVPTDRWLGFLPGRLAEYAAGNPLRAYAGFLDTVAVPNAAIFAHLTAWGEATVGIGLTAGLFTRIAAGVGALLMLNYFLASFWMGPSQQGFHLILLVCMVVFIGARAGRYWGLDAVRLHRRTAHARNANGDPA